MEFVRITQPEIFRLVPRELFEQIKDTHFNIDVIYTLSDMIIKNPLTHFYLIVNEEKKIIGFFWAMVNLITESLDIVTISVDKKYQFKGVLEKTFNFVKSWCDTKILITTPRPKAYERMGFNQSKQVILEMD